MLVNKVDIAGIEFDVKEIDNLIYEHNLGGQIFYEKGIIHIDSSMCDDKKEQVLVHEILHGIFDQAGYDEQDEDMVNRLGVVLYQVLKNNNLYFGDIPER